ncbi:MAG: hypothetical protein GY830_09130 [Bacteroidetes bacterium]|nr:hypothetical protein [Bacteroidota bacterium]
MENTNINNTKNNFIDKKSIEYIKAHQHNLIACFELFYEWDIKDQKEQENIKKSKESAKNAVKKEI